MAVAVKTPTGPAPASPLSRPAVASLLGMVYVVGCLAVVFAGIPALWTRVSAAIGLASGGFVSGSLLGLVMLGTAAGLLYLGGRALGTQAPPGIRAGIFTGLMG